MANQITFSTGDKLRLTTPVVSCRYPRLNKPDTKFHKDGAYKVELLLSDADPTHAAFLEELDQLWDQAVAEARAMGGKVAVAAERAEKPWQPLEDDPGVRMIRAKMKAKTAKGIDRRPPLFGADGQPYVSDEYLGGGSLLRVNLAPRPYYGAAVGFGITFYLNAVQVLRAVGGRDSAESYGFDAVDQEAVAAGGASWDEAYDAAEGDQ